MTVDSDELIRVTTHGSVGTIWLNRASKRNAMSYSMWVALEEASLALSADREVRVVVLRGSGAHFCAGADITELRASRPADQRPFSDVVFAAERALAMLPKPTVAFITGDCIGGGASIAIDCDLRVATPDSRFGITPAKLGIVYPSAALERATHLLGPAVTKRMLFTGQLMDAADAYRVGLVDELVDAASAEKRLATLTGVLAARSLVTQAATKAMVAEIGAHGQVSDDLQSHWHDIADEAPDAREGIAAFVEKREPRFTWTGSDGR